jgi:hypothetical protein
MIILDIAISPSQRHLIFSARNSFLTQRFADLLAAAFLKIGGWVNRKRRTARNG